MITARLRPHASVGRDDGAVAVVVSIMMITLIAILAFTADFGVAYAQRRAISTGTDSAVLGVARAYQQQAAQNPSWTCAQVAAAVAVDRQTVAASYFGQNAPGGTNLQPVDATCVSPSTGLPVGSGPAVLRITATGDRNAGSIFGGVLGASGYHIERTSTAVVGPAGQINGLRPFGVCATDANALLSQVSPSTPNPYTLIKLDNAGSSCGQAAGNWGTLTLPGTNNNGTGQASVCGTNLSSAIVYGTCTPVSVNSGQLTLPISGNPGFPSGGSIGSELDSIIGLPIVLPVYTTVSNGGANTTYGVNGFLAVRMCGWWSGNKSGTSPTGAGVNCFNAAPQYVPSGGNNNVDSLQLQYLSFIPLANVSTICGIGAANTDPSCGTRPSVVQLVK